MEEYRPLLDYPNYLVSNIGNVKSVRGNILKPCITKNRRRVLLYKDNIPFSRTVYRLVAIAFLPNPDNLPQVDHINRNPIDDRVDNLRWVTQSQNLMNTDVFKNNKLGIKHISKRGSRYRVIIMKGKNDFDSGSFLTLEEAIVYRDNKIEERSVGCNKSAPVK